MASSSVALRQPLPPVEWWRTDSMVSLIKRSAFRDCNDVEFDEAVAVARELRLNPLRKQIYAFVFDKDQPTRNMVLVVAIDGGRAIAARTGNYRPDDAEPHWTYDDKLMGPANPHGIVKCTVGVFHRPTAEDPFQRIVGAVHWDEFAPIILGGSSEDDYEWIETDQVWPEGHKRAGQKKMRKKLKPGVQPHEMLDPRKPIWTRSGRHMIAKCAEMLALRKGWPEDMSRIYEEAEVDRAVTIEADYEDVTPSEQVKRADTEKRQDKLGGQALFAVVDKGGVWLQERVLVGQFADFVLAAVKGKPTADVTKFVEANRHALREFWGYNQTDALALKKELEKLQGGATSAASSQPAQAEPVSSVAEPAVVESTSTEQPASQSTAAASVAPAAAEQAASVASNSAPGCDGGRRLPQPTPELTDKDKQLYEELTGLPAILLRLPSGKSLPIAFMKSVKYQLSLAGDAEQLEVVWNVLSHKLTDCPPDLYEQCLRELTLRENELTEESKK